MKKSIFFFAAIIIITASSTFAQKGDMVLSFDGKDANTGIPVPLESVFVENLSQNGDTTVYGETPFLYLAWPSAIDEFGWYNSDGFKLESNFPNPFIFNTRFNLSVLNKEKIWIKMYDVYGSVVYEIETELNHGIHSFEVFTGKVGVYFLTVSNELTTKTNKLVSKSTGKDNKYEIRHVGTNELPELKNQEMTDSFSFQPGDELALKATAEGYYDTAIFDNPSENTSYTFELKLIPALPIVTTEPVTDITFTSATSGGNVTNDGGADVSARGVCWSTSQNPTIDDNHTNDGTGTGIFTSYLTELSENSTYYVRAYATNESGTAYGDSVSFTLPGGCKGITEVNYGGQMYETVEIGNQCWFKENLNYETSSSWCYDDNPANCDTYGRLYKASSALGSICPNGWHLPSDLEWKILEGTVDSQYPVCDPVWNGNEFRGFDSGLNLKSTTGWDNNGNGTDLYDFGALPGGYRGPIGTYFGQGFQGIWWSSSLDIGLYYWCREIFSNNDMSRRYSWKVTGSYSVRCIKDSELFLPTVSTAEITDTTQATATSGGNVTESGSYPVTARGVCWSTSQNPDISNYHTTDGSGPGAFTSQITGLVQNTTYFVRAYATNILGTVYGNMVDFTTLSGSGSGNGVPCPGIETVTYGGQVYNTVLIGNQCWFKENLNYETGNSWCYSNNPAHCDTYGRLYDWETALNVCPQTDGWHLPSDAEWKILEGTVDSQYPVGDPVWNYTNARGLDAGKNLKSTSGWDNNGVGTDIYGFRALPGGLRTDGTFIVLGFYGNWWSSSESATPNPWSRTLASDSDRSSRGFSNKTHGYSVRCVKDF